MAIVIADTFLYTLLFADDQFIIASDIENTCYVTLKLQEEYAKRDLNIIINGTEHLTGEDRGVRPDH